MIVYVLRYLVMLEPCVDLKELLRGTSGVRTARPVLDSF